MVRNDVVHIFTHGIWVRSTSVFLCLFNIKVHITGRPRHRRCGKWYECVRLCVIHLVQHAIFKANKSAKATTYIRMLRLPYLAASFVWPSNYFPCKTVEVMKIGLLYSMAPVRSFSPCCVTSDFATYSACVQMCVFVYVAYWCYYDVCRWRAEFLDMVKNCRISKEQSSHQFCKQRKKKSSHEKREREKERKR